MLLTYKYSLNCSGLDMIVFDRMIDFAAKNEYKMKGIIDFEIATKKSERSFFVPVFYSQMHRIGASYDAVYNTDYLDEAKTAKDNVLKYMKEQGVRNIVVEEIQGELKVNKDGFYGLQAYKISY